MTTLAVLLVARLSSACRSASALLPLAVICIGLYWACEDLYKW